MSEIKLSTGNDCVKKRRLNNDECDFYERDNKPSSSEDFHRNTEKNNLQYLESPIKLSIDDREYRTIKLNNGLKALLISNTKQEKAHCSLCINVGNFSDPPHVQGLAHLLEHVITMGSKKYPQEKEYNAFITNRWGETYAYTEDERTTYAFEIPDKCLAAAMDYFANMFIAPLMSKDTISRERLAVESEFKLNQHLDGCRKTQLKHSFAKHNHPASKFSWGNSLTFDKNIELDELYVELHKFYKRHYSAHRMTLVVQSTLQSLDILEENVKICFSDVPVNHLPPDDFSMYKGIESFDSVKFRQLYYVKTTKDASEIELNWVMPPMQQLYKSKPWVYVIWLLTRKENGSLSSYLRKKLWSFNLVVQGDDDYSFYDTSIYYLMSLTIYLSDKGYANYEEVLNSIFSYINLIKREGVQKEIFDHIRQIRENHYKSNFHNEADNYYECLSHNMQYYEPSDYIHGYDLIFEYDPEAIQTCLNCLSAENVNIIISSKKLKESETAKIEPWFQMKYSVKEIPKQWIELWKVIDPLPEFSIPLKQSLLKQISITNNHVKPAVTIPIKLHNKDIEVWFKRITDSNHSDFSLYLHLINPLYCKSVINSVVAMVMLFAILSRVDVDDALVNLQVFPSTKGIIIQNDSCKTVSPSQMSTLLENLMTYCQIRMDDIHFDLIKKVLLTKLHNSFIQPDDLSVEIHETIITPSYWNAVEKYNVLLEMNFDQFKEQITNFQNEFYIQCLVKGSMSSEEVLNYINEAIQPLRTTAKLINSYTDIVTRQFDLGERFCQVQNLNSLDVNTVVTNYYQIGPVTVQTNLLLDLLLNIIGVPLFDILRTKEQLGYKIWWYVSFYQGLLFITISITTQADKFTACYVDERIENFMKHFQGTLMSMTSDEFNIVKENFVSLKRQALEANTDHLKEDWAQIVYGVYAFRQLDEEIALAQNIRLEDLIQFFNNHMIPGPNYRKLSVQVVGTSDLSKAGEMLEEKYSLKFSTEITEKKKQEKAGCYIDDLNAFRMKFLNEM